MKKLLLWLICIFLVGLNVKMSYGLDVGLDSSDIGVVMEIPDAPINYSTIATVNSSDFWDNLNDPSDINMDDLGDFVSRWIEEANTNRSADVDFDADVNLTIGYLHIPFGNISSVDSIVFRSVTNPNENFIGAKYGTMQYYATSSHSFNQPLSMPTGEAVNQFSFATGSMGGMSHVKDDGMHLYVRHANGWANNNFILTEQANALKDHDHELLSPDPTMFFQGNTDVDIDNTHWGSITYHNNTQQFRFNVGNGTMNVSIDEVLVEGNITSENVFIPQYIFSHTNRTQPLVAVNVWTNVTFDQEVADLKFGISHNGLNESNNTFSIMEDGIYEVDYDFDVEDSSGTPSDIDVAGRIILINGTEIIGSVFETDIAKQGVSTELSHDFLIRCLAGEQFKFQFVADNGAVVISTHGTFGDHPESATIVIKKVANL